MLKGDLKKITIKDLLRDGKISVRTSNCCFNAAFESLFDILKYYESRHSFLNIRNAGRKTCSELENLCKEYIPQIEISVDTDGFSENENEAEHENVRPAEVEILIKEDVIGAINNKLIDGKDILSSLGVRQKEILKKKFEDCIKKYSTRTKNRLTSIGFDNFVINYLFVENHALLKINGLGKKSLEEAIDLKNKIKEEYLYLINLTEDDIVRLNLVRKKLDINQNNFVDEFYKINNHLPMFWILEQNLVTSKNRNIDILIDTFPVFQNYQFRTFKDIAAKYDISRERIRQIRNDTFHNTFEITNKVIDYKKNSDLIKYAELLQNKDDWKYILEFLQGKEVINQESFEIQELLKKEQCNLSALFVLQIIAYIFRDKYFLLGGLSISNQSKNNTFLIRKEFADIFNFEKFIEEFASHIAENETEYDLNVDEFLCNNTCWIHGIDLDKFDNIVHIVKEIILNEFHLYSNLDGLITIPSTKGRNPRDVVYDILKVKGEPMHLHDIFVEFKKILPEHKYTQENNPDKLRPYLQKHEYISYRNRRSIYTLKEWEHIRTGTIRDAIISFLEDKDLPQSADDITEYVLLHFPETNIASVRTSMFNDTQKRFSFFSNGLFGLVRKKYPAEYKEIKQKVGQRKSFEQRLYDLEKFLSENDHYPFSSSDNEEENSLYRWWRTINRDPKLSELQKAEIERIKNQYAELDTEKTVYEWFCHFNDFKLFVLENHRLPSSNSPEKFLYGWFLRAKNDFLNDRLNEKQRTKYAEFFKEIKYVEK